VRICFEMKIALDSLQDYLDEHRAVCKEYQAALHRNGVRNYSLFHRDNGYVAGYFESEVSMELTWKKLNQEPVCNEWHEKLRKYAFDGARPDKTAVALSPYFYNGTSRIATLDAKKADSTGSFEAQDQTSGGGFTRTGRKRICFQMKFDTADLPQYLEDHKKVWPEMQEALQRCGWGNYSLFYREDGFALGFFDAEKSFEDCLERMGQQPVNSKWQDAMKKYTAENVRPDEAMMGELKHHMYLGNDRKKA